MEWIKTKLEQWTGYRNENPILSKSNDKFWLYTYEEQWEWMFEDSLRLPIWVEDAFI